MVCPRYLTILISISPVFWWNFENTNSPEAGLEGDCTRAESLTWDDLSKSFKMFQSFIDIRQGGWVGLDHPPILHNSSHWKMGSLRASHQTNIDILCVLESDESAYITIYHQRSPYLRCFLSHVTGWVKSTLQPLVRYQSHSAARDLRASQGLEPPSSAFEYLYAHL